MCRSFPHNRKASSGLAMLAAIAVSTVSLPAAAQEGAVPGVLPGGVSPMMDYEDIAAALDEAGYMETHSPLPHQSRIFQPKGSEWNTLGSPQHPGMRIGGLHSIDVLFVGRDGPASGVKNITWESLTDRSDCYSAIAAALDTPGQCRAGSAPAPGERFICTWPDAIADHDVEASYGMGRGGNSCRITIMRDSH